MLSPVKHRAPIPAGALDVKKIHHMFYEAAFWRVQAMNEHIVSSDAFEHEWHTVFFFGLMHAMINPVAEPTVERLVRNWARTESVENGEYNKLQTLTNSFTKQLCAQFWHIMHTQGPQAAQAYAHGEEALRCQARDKVLAMEVIAQKHDMALAREAEYARKSLIVLLAACEIVDALIGLAIITPAALAFTGIGAVASGISIPVALWVVPAVSLAVAEVENFSTAPPHLWQVVAASATIGSSRRVWSFHAFPRARKLTKVLDARAKYIDRTSGRDFNEAHARYKYESVQSNGKYASLPRSAGSSELQRLSDLGKARANLNVDLKAQSVLSRNLGYLKASNRILPVVFAAATIIQASMNVTRRWNE